MAKTKYTRQNDGYFQTKAWDGTYTELGKKHYISLRSKKSSKDLEEKVLALKNKVRQGMYVSNSNILFTEYAKYWLETKKTVRADNTKTMYQNIVEKHLQVLEGVRLIDIRNNHFQQVITNASDMPRTCQQIYITFKQIINMAVAENYIGKGMADMICMDINLPRYIKREKRPLTEVEKTALSFAEFTDRERAYIYIIYCCGLRRGEALALQKTDFTFQTEENSVSITKTIVFCKNKPIIKQTPKTEKGIRNIPVPKNVAIFLMKYMESMVSQYLFTTNDGHIITQSSYVKMWKSIVKKINVAAGGTDSFPKVAGLTAHIFRHNYCTELCYKIPEISIKKIAYLLGDTEKMVMQVYNHIQEEKENPLDVIEKVFGI